MMLSFQSWFASRRLLHFLCLSILTCALVLLPTTIARGQDLSFLSQKASAIPPDGVIRYGSIEATWVQSPLDGEDLFQIAAATVTDRQNLGPDDLPVEIRAQSIEALLQIEFERFHDNVFRRLVHKWRLWPTDELKARTADVIISTLNNRPVIQIKGSDRSRPLTIITVTQTDVDFYSETPEVLSAEWSRILQGEIEQIEQLSSLKVVYRGLWWSLAILLGAIAVTGLCACLHWLTGRQRRRLKQQRDTASESETARTDSASLSAPPSDEATAPPDNGAQPVTISPSVDTLPSGMSRAQRKLSGLRAERSRFLEILHQEPPLERKLSVLKFLQWLLVWLVVFAWYCSLIGLTYTLPIIRYWRSTLLSEPFKLLLIWFVVNLALRVNRTLTHRFTQMTPGIAAKQSGEAQRKLLRTNTIGGAWEGLATVVIILTGMLLTLSTFGLSTQSVLAWGAVFGLALSFGAQSLIKDVVNGCLILFEDQFAVGDVVAIGTMSGLVEEMSLRSTRLRDPEGQLITIPNGNIAEVRNLTRLWSRVDFTIEVAYDNDPDKVLTLLNEVAQEMYAQPEWCEKMPHPPEVLGIDRLSHAGILIRVWLQTAPLQQWVVGREYRLRVRRVFARHDVAIGRPQWISYNTVLKKSPNHDGLIIADSQDVGKQWQTEGVNYEADYDVESEQA
ncbi:MAG: mechanosensitive ion channel family protein [Cyanobacteria bacterium P01_F01_bin.86]